MVFVKEKPDYVFLDPDFKPGPRNGHLSEKAANFVEVEADTRKALEGVWAPEVPLEEFKNIWATFPPAIPVGCPEPGKGVVLENLKAMVRDGTELDVKVYKNPGEGKVEKATMVFRMHGGGWTVGSHETEEAENRYFGAIPGVVVVSVNYRMAPEFPYPIPMEDSLDTLKWAKENAESLGINPEKIIVAGNSGGANMAACLALKAKREGVTGIVAQSLVFPPACHPKFFDRVPNKEKYELLSYVQNQDAAVVNPVRMEFFWDAYLGKDPQPDPGHSPLLHSIEELRGLPPALIQVAGLDPMRDEGIAYSEALKEAGNDVELEVYPGLPHCFYMFTGFEQTKAYFERVIAFVKKHADA